MAQIWVPAPIGSAVRGQEYLGRRILAVGKKEFVIYRDKTCKDIPTLILHAGRYKSVLIDY